MTAPYGPGMGMAGLYGGPPPDPEMARLAEKEGQLEREIQNRCERFHQPEVEQKEKIKAEIREIVAQQFELRQERRRLELKRLEEEMKHMREIIERRDKARDRIINRHVSELLGEEDELRF
jgi:hypothetical protein